MPRRARCRLGAAARAPVQQRLARFQNGSSVLLISLHFLPRSVPNRHLRDTLGKSKELFRDKCPQFRTVSPLRSPFADVLLNGSDASTNPCETMVKVREGDPAREALGGGYGTVEEPIRARPIPLALPLQHHAVATPSQGTAQKTSPSARCV